MQSPSPGEVERGLVTQAGRDGKWMIINKGRGRGGRAHLHFIENKQGQFYSKNAMKLLLPSSGDGEQ
jgi:hypothetical protein